MPADTMDVIEEDRNPIGSRIPVTVLSGALGSGKTTLLKYILERPHGFRVAVIQNEFSEEMGIEAPLITDEKGETFKDIVELPNGCLCCSAKDGLLVALDRLLEDKRRFDYVLVEATGIADPEAVCEIFWVDDGLGCRVYLDGVVTLVDAHHALAALGSEDSISGQSGRLGLEAETAKQVACADILVLNKSDLAPEADRKRVADKLREMNPVANLLHSKYAAVPLESILGIKAFDRSRVATMMGELAEVGHSDGHGGGHGHDDGMSGHGGAHGHEDGHNDGHGNLHGHGAESSSSSTAGYGHAPLEQRSVRAVSGHRGVEGILLKGDDSASARYDPDKVQSWLANVLWELTAGGVFRCKGIFLGPSSRDDDDEEDEPMPSEGAAAAGARDETVAYAVQGVGRLFEIEEAPHVDVKTVPRSKFLFIGKDIKREVLESGLRDCLIES